MREKSSFTWTLVISLACLLLADDAHAQTSGADRPQSPGRTTLDRFGSYQATASLALGVYSPLGGIGVSLGYDFGRWISAEIGAGRALGGIAAGALATVRPVMGERVAWTLAKLRA